MVGTKNSGWWDGAVLLLEDFNSLSKKNRLQYSVWILLGLSMMVMMMMMMTRWIQAGRNHWLAIFLTDPIYLESLNYLVRRVLLKIKMVSSDFFRIIFIDYKYDCVCFYQPYEESILFNFIHDYLFEQSSISPQITVDIYSTIIWSSWHWWWSFSACRVKNPRSKWLWSVSPALAFGRQKTRSGTYFSHMAGRCDIKKLRECGCWAGS